MWKQLEGMIVCVDPLLESGTFKSTGETRELLILPGLDNVRLRAVCKDPVPVYVYSLEDDDRPMYTTAEMILLDQNFKTSNTPKLQVAKAKAWN